MAPKTENTPAEPKTCKCGCGESTQRNFAQGHDQRFVSKLAEDTVNGRPPTGLGLLSQAKAKRPVAERIELVAEQVLKSFTQALADKFESAALRKVAKNEAPKRAVKSGTDKAATPTTPRKSRKPRTVPKTKPSAEAVVKAEPQTAAEVEHDELKSTPDGRPSKVATRRVGEVHTARLGIGANIKIKVRGREIDAQVAAMNQAGKVTVATYTGAKDVERRIENPTVVDPASD